MKWSSASAGRRAAWPAGRRASAGTISSPPGGGGNAASGASAGAPASEVGGPPGMTTLPELDASHTRSKSVYLFIGATALWIVTVRSALADIAKMYVPINQDDLPKRVYQLIQAGLTRVAVIAYEAQPVHEDIEHPGWGRPGSELENVNFRAQIIAAQELIEKAAVRHSEEFARPPLWSTSRYISFLVDAGLVDRKLGRHYVERYEAAQFSGAAVTEQEFADFMKLQYLVLNGMDFYDEEGLETSYRSSVSISSSGASMLLGLITDNGNEADDDSDGRAPGISMDVL